MFEFEEQADLVQDREDLIALVTMRFGDLPPEVIQDIYKKNKLDDIERLFLVAGNAPDFKTFLEELQEGEGSFKVLGERFNPIAQENKKDEANG
ncbi:hypothetical protein GWK91_05665 [Virgibacillus sp. MSP4-1]|uniref:hypothetical protein n=1 Tax=Virgibacillus sp. MSP4-1 TaxID=2700081 RepID=UPI0003A2436D|nr:hypothetical protein [Virgibacillus sp. MSP4-1]QHS22469.1 hypothetical protein GWK91_05665 [Virgibacillus sp. MSP4-1]